MPTPASPPITDPRAAVRTGPILDTYRTFTRLPFGRRLFSWAVCLKAPYFASVHPRFGDLQPGQGEVNARLRRSVKNHLGGFHAIAACNLAELVAGTTLDASLPRTHRWIPKSMTVNYLTQARTGLTATATVEDLTGLAADEARETVVPVDLTDRHGTTVVHADITMWVSPRR